MNEYIIALVVRVFISIISIAYILHVRYKYKSCNQPACFDGNSFDIDWSFFGGGIRLTFLYVEGIFFII